LGLKRREARNPHSAVLCESKTDVDLEVLCAAPPEALPHSPSRADPRRGTHRHSAGLWTCMPPRLRPPRRHTPRNTSPRRRVVDLQATAPSPTTPTCAEEHIATTPGCRSAGHRTFAHADTRRTLRWAVDRAPQRPRPPARAEENFARRRAAVSLHFAPSTTPTAPILCLLCDCCIIPRQFN